MAVEFSHFRIPSLILVILLGQGAIGGLISPAKQHLGPGPINFVGTVANGIRDFVVKFYPAAVPENQNFAFSPFSLAAAFAIIEQGTDGATKAELVKILNFPASDVILQLGFKEILQGLAEITNSETFNVTAINQLFVDPKFPILPAYQTNVEMNFAANITSLGLDPAAAALINSVIASSTHNRINNLLSAQDLQNDPQLVLASTLFFHTAWQNAFEPSATTKQKFFVGPHAEDFVEVNTMHKTFEVSTAILHIQDANVLALPVQDGRFTMWIFLPRDRNGLSKILDNLENLPSIDDIRQKMTPQRVALALPKFQFQTTVNLKTILNKLGVNLLFNGAGDFSNMTSVDISSLAVSSSSQMSFMYMQETAIKGIASTDAVVGLSGPVTGPATLPPPTPASRQVFPPIRQIAVDHPFFFLISDAKNSDLILFAGQVINPSIVSGR